MNLLPRPMPNRREMLHRSAALAGLLAGLGLLPEAARAAYRQAAFAARTAGEALEALGVAAPVESRELDLQGPDKVENGASVPLSLACARPDVRRMLLLVEKNPAPLAAVFEVGEVIEPRFGIRVKMAASSAVIAVAITAEGRVLFAQKDIGVTVGSCGD